MRIWKVACFTLAALASGDLGHSACATLSNTATASRNPDLATETLANQVSVAQTEPTVESQQLSQSVKGKLTKRSAQTFQQLAIKTSEVAQGRMLSDIQGNWAQSFIEVLTNRGIIEGFPDGTFRPEEPVTRAQFAAMLQKAFQKDPVRNPIQFVDTPGNYWGSTAIQTAYKTGFLEGYPGRIFKPEQNIPRVQILVSLVSGLNLSANNTTSTVLNSYFQDAAQIPDYARQQVTAALQNHIVVDHPNVEILNPNQVATRAEVAAFIYQALVRAGMAPDLTSSDTATQYIVGYKPPQNPAPPTAQIEDLRERYRLPQISSRELKVVTGIVSAPGSSVASPTAFGAQFGDVFFGGSYQARARFTDIDDGAIVFGFGLGQRQTVGLEVAVSSFSTFREGFFTNGGVSFKLHHLFPHGLAIAAGVENAATFGSPDGGSSVYGVASKIFQLRDDITKPFSTATVSVGLGGGRFRSEHDVQNGIDSVNVFGSVGVRIAEPISLIADWTGQDLTIGTSIAPFRNIPIVITPAVADVTGNAGDGARFILGVGFGYSF